MRSGLSSLLAVASLLATAEPATAQFSRLPSLSTKAEVAAAPRSPSRALASYRAALASAPHGLDTSCFLSEEQLAVIAAKKEQAPYKIAPRETVSRATLHVTEWSFPASYAKFCKNANAHALIAKNGRLSLFVPPSWNSDDAGLGMWNGALPNRNTYSIEFEAKRTDTLTTAQNETGDFLIDYLVETYGFDRAQDFPWHYQVATGAQRKPSRGRKWDGICQRDEPLGVARPVNDLDALAGRVQGWGKSLAQLRSELGCE